MFFETIPVVFAFEDEDIKEKLIRLNEELGPYGFGRYLAALVEKDLNSEEVNLNREVKSNSDKSEVQSTPSNINTEVINELVSKVQELLEKGVPVSGVPASSMKKTSAGDLSVMDAIMPEVKEVVPTPVIVKKKKKSKLGGLKNSDMNSILSKMNSMTK